MKDVNRLKSTYQRNLLLGMIISTIISCTVCVLMLYSSREDMVIIDTGASHIVIVRLDQELPRDDIPPDPEETVPAIDADNRVLMDDPNTVSSRLLGVVAGRLHEKLLTDNILSYGNDATGIGRAGNKDELFGGRIIPVGDRALPGLDGDTADKYATVGPVCGRDYAFDFNAIPNGLSRIERIEWRKKNKPLRILCLEGLPKQLANGLEGIVAISCIIDTTGKVVGNEEGVEIVIENPPGLGLARMLKASLLQTSRRGNILAAVIDGQPVPCVFSLYWEINSTGVSQLNMAHNVTIGSL